MKFAFYIFPEAKRRARVYTLRGDGKWDFDMFEDDGTMVNGERKTGTLHSSRDAAIVTLVLLYGAFLPIAQADLIAIP